jgi:hypothetical protein
MGEIAVNTPISIFICFSQSASRDFTSDSNVIKFLFHSSQTDFNVSETVSICQLGECHTDKLVKTSKSSDIKITFVPINAHFKIIHW